MENWEQKVYFLKHELSAIMGKIDPEAKALFGKMNPQQMVEHMSEYIRLAYGQPKHSVLAYEEEVIDTMRAFLQTEKPFRPNTGNPLLPDTPTQTKFPNYRLALDDVDQAIQSFFDFFGQYPQAFVLNPFFGNLNFELSVQLLYKHGQHHLRKFGMLA